MSRLTTLTDSAAPPASQEIFSALKTKIGFVPNLYRVIGNQPAVLGALLGFGEALGKGGFGAPEREAIALAVAGANNCDYCASAHSAISASLKVGSDEIAARLKGKSGDSRVQAIIAFAVALVEKKGFVSDADLAGARAAGLSDADIVETVANVAQNILTNYLNHVAQTEIDFPVVKARAA